MLTRQKSYLIMEMLSHYLCHILWVRSRSLGYPILKKRDIHRAWVIGSGGHPRPPGAPPSGIHPNQFFRCRSRFAACHPSLPSCLLPNTQGPFKGQQTDSRKLTRALGFHLVPRIWGKDHTEKPTHSFKSKRLLRADAQRRRRKKTTKEKEKPRGSPSAFANVILTGLPHPPTSCSKEKRL